MPAVATRADALRIKVSSVETKHLHAVGTLDGVIVLAAAARNGPGTGRIRSTGDGMNLAWKAPGSSTFGAAVPIPADGQFLVEDGEDQSKWIRVKIHRDHLLPGPVEARVFLSDVFENDVSDDDVTAAEAAAGDVETWTLDLTNDGTVTFSHVKAWIDAAVSGLEISDDGASWVNPTTEATALDLADVPAAGSITLHVRRTIAASADEDPDVLNHVHLGFNGL